MSEVAIDSFHSKLGRIKIITDEPTLEDALDFKNYSSRLADIIKGSTPRFSIGVFGGWGTGKTSLMKMIKQILDMNDKIVTVWFMLGSMKEKNTWQLYLFLELSN